MNDRLVVLLCASSLATVVSAQTTHLVGPSGLPEIRDALAIAAPGDVIEVQAGTYAQFDVTVGVTIRALVPGTVSVLYDIVYMPPGCSAVSACVAAEGATRFQVPPGQAAHVTGVHFDADAILVLPSGGTVFTRVEVLGGRVTFDDCRFRSRASQALRIEQATVHLQGCTVENMDAISPGAGLRAIGSSVTAVGGLFAGAATAIAFILHGVGIDMTNSTFVGSSLHARSGFNTPSFGAPGIRGDAGSSIWLSNATVQGSGSSCALDFAGPQQLARITWIGNVCGITAADFVLGVTRPAPLQRGTTFQLLFHTDPNGFAAVFASPQLDTHASSLFEPALELGLGLTGLLNGGIVLANGSGLATASYPIPNTPSLLAQSFWFQGMTGLAFPLRTSAVVGGVVR